MNTVLVKPRLIILSRPRTQRAGAAVHGELFGRRRLGVVGHWD